MKKLKVVLNVALGIGTETAYALSIILAAGLLCLLFSAAVK